MKALSINYLSVSKQEGANMPLANILSVFASQNAHPDHFYLTGFEGICVDTAHTQVCEAVVSSVIPFDRELLVLGSEHSQACALWRNICRSLDIQVSFLDSTDENLIDALAAVLETNRNITHVVCSSERSSEQLRAIGKSVRAHRRALIVDNCTDVISMANINDFYIDFLITAAADDETNPMSLVVARRSRLVQTEGNARKANHDIYALWQQMVGGRLSTLEPMA